MNRKTLNLYNKLYYRHGDSPASVKARDSLQQSLRFKYLLECLQLKNHHKILDVGCGLGDFLKYLRKNNLKCKYLGVDF